MRNSSTYVHSLLLHHIGNITVLTITLLLLSFNLISCAGQGGTDPEMGFLDNVPAPEEVVAAVPTPVPTATPIPAPTIIPIPIPTVTIISPLEHSFINLNSNSSTFAISGTCDLAEESVVIKIDTTPATAPNDFICDGTNFAGTIDTTGLSEGAHTFTAELTNSNTKVGVSPSVNVTKDTVPPQATLIIPSDSSLIIHSTDSLDFAVSGTCNKNGITVEININGFAATSQNGFLCDGSNFHGTIDTTILTDGDHAFNAAITDTIGNTSTSSTNNITKATTLPTISITYAPDITAANHTAYTISGNCNELLADVYIAIGTLPFTSSCNDSSWTLGPIDASSLSDIQALSISADITDARGNQAIQANISVNKTTITPTITISETTSNITLANVTSHTISGTCSQNGEMVTVNIGTITLPANCTSGTWLTSIIDTTSLIDGTILITADHSTAIQATKNIIKDTVSPVVTISSAPNISITNQLTYIASGMCSEDGVGVTVIIGSINYSLTCNSNTWTTGPVDVSSIPDGDSILLSTDHSTAIQTSTIIYKSTTTPSISNLSIVTTLQDSINLAWWLSDPSGFTIDDYIVNFRIKGSPTWLNFSDEISTSKNTTVTNLTESTIYEFRVAVKYNSTEQSKWSNSTDGETKPANEIFKENVAINIGGATTTTVVAYKDNTAITLNGAPLVTLNRGQTHIFTSVIFDIIDANWPIFTAGRKGSGTANTKGNIVWQPTSWAGKSFSFNATRESNQYLTVFAVENTSIEVKQGTTILASTTLSANEPQTLTWTTLGSYQIYSTGNILAYHISGNSTSYIVDPKPLLPNSFEIIGFPSRSMRLTTTLDATNFNIIHSNSVTNYGSLNKTTTHNINPEGDITSYYQGESLLINSDNKVFGASYADANGYCAAPFMPTSFMKEKYVLPVSADYIAFASKEPGIVEIIDESGALITTLTLTRSGGALNAPYSARTTLTGAGYIYSSTIPIAAWYQPNSDTGASAEDETIMYGTN